MHKSHSSKKQAPIHVCSIHLCNAFLQRRLFHVQANILELTGRRPRLEAGRRLRAIAVAPARVKDRDSATA